MLVGAGRPGDLDPEAIVVHGALEADEVASGVLVLEAQPHELALPEGHEGGPRRLPETFLPHQGEESKHLITTKRSLLDIPMRGEIPKENVSLLIDVLNTVQDIT